MPYKFREIKNKLTRLGFKIVRQKGSHVLFSNGKVTFPVPNHGSKDISPWVEKKVLQLTSKTRKEFDAI